MVEVPRVDLCCVHSRSKRLRRCILDPLLLPQPLTPRGKHGTVAERHNAARSLGFLGLRGGCNRDCIRDRNQPRSSADSLMFEPIIVVIPPQLRLSAWHPQHHHSRLVGSHTSPGGVASFMRSRNRDMFRRARPAHRKRFTH